MKRTNAGPHTDPQTCWGNFRSTGMPQTGRPAGMTDAQDPLVSMGVYLLRSGEDVGPFALAQARQLLAEGRISTNDLVKLGLKGRPFPASVLAETERHWLP